jgi:hypothetical protein
MAPGSPKNKTHSEHTDGVTKPLILTFTLFIAVNLPGTFQSKPKTTHLKFPKSWKKKKLNATLLGGT